MQDNKSWDESYRSNCVPWRSKAPNLSFWLMHVGNDRGDALDLGCGTGELAGWLSQHGFHVLGLDFSDEALEKARHAFPSVSFDNWDLDQLADYPFQRSAYDLIVDRLVYVFLKDKERYLQTIKEKLRGTFILDVVVHNTQKPSLEVPASTEALLTSIFDVSRTEKIITRFGERRIYYLK